MTRFLAILAVSGLAAGAAFAEATHEQAMAINRYAPDVDVSMLSDAQVEAAFAAANGSDSDAEKRSQIEFIAGGGGTAPTTFSEEQIALIEQYVTPDEVSMMTGQQMGDALAIINGEDGDAEKSARIRAMIGN
ncbi:hypothetical protein PVT71_03460 [Salipiger sp. H15]|uniref:DUF4168 domain-containing protein n=1 Tax=Alloyangia sp. H15 TaxID=3029062 RepID=A0AAU8AID4_9RHOB